MNNESVQAENSVFFKQLDICCKKVALAVGEKSISEWKNSDYIKLSSLLHRKTKVHLSENTLKRIFGKLKKPTRYYPQKATRDALAQFLDFRDWQEFERLNPVSEKDLTITTDNGIDANPKTPKKKNYIYIVVAICIVLAALVCYHLINKDKFINVKLICLNPVGQTPHSALFELSHKDPLPDSSNKFTIDFNDERKAIKPFLDTVVSHYYGNPGRFYPKLLYKGKVIDTAFVYLQTKGWVAIASNEYDTTRVFPIRPEKVSNGNKVFSPIEEIHKAGIDTNRTFYVTFSNIKPTQISADHFEMSANIKTSDLRAGIRCSQVDIFIYGEKDNHALGFMMPACIAWCYYKFSENAKRGSLTDLRALGVDLRNEGLVNLKIVHQKVSLFVNKKMIFTTKYKKPIGKIKGVKFYFSGVGTVKNFNLVDLNTRERF